MLQWKDQLEMERCYLFRCVDVLTGVQHFKVIACNKTQQNWPVRVNTDISYSRQTVYSPITCYPVGGDTHTFGFQQPSAITRMSAIGTADSGTYTPVSSLALH